MVHERMFDDDDPVLARVRAIALGLPEAQEKVSHGRPAFFTTKVFAYYGGALKVDGTWVQHAQSVVLQAPPDERAALRERANCYVPGYLGPSGWTGLDLTEDTDWQELVELIEIAYRETAPKRLVRALDSDESTSRTKSD